MVEPSESPDDHSDMRPPKRLTRIVAGSMFGWSLIMAFVFQLVLFEVTAASVNWHLTFIADSQGFVLTRRHNHWSKWTGFNFGFFPREMPTGQERATRWHTLIAYESEPICSVPGLTLYSAKELWSSNHWAVTVHHLWLICISAVLYLATYARNKRSVRIQNPPS